MTVTLHHEINNPLMAAFADVELLLLEDTASAAHRREGLENIRQALLRIRDIVQRIGELKEVRSTDYVHGTRMLDLGPTGQAVPGVDRGTALLHLPDEGNARVVSLLLRDAGFRVQHVGSIAELEIAAGSIGVSLVVLAGGSGTPGAHPLAGFMPPPDRSYHVVALVGGSGEAALAAGADQVVQLPFDPGTFTEEVTASLG
jgi:hypothetical protein